MLESQFAGYAEVTNAVEIDGRTAQCNAGRDFRKGGTRVGFGARRSRAISDVLLVAPAEPRER